MTQPTKPTPEPMPASVRCCKSKHVTTTVDPHVFACSDCNILFDPQDDGDVGKGGRNRPDRVAERREAEAQHEEERRQRQLQNLVFRYGGRRR